MTRELTCKRCGEPFYSRLQIKKYCGPECAVAANRAYVAAYNRRRRAEGSQGRRRGPEQLGPSLERVMEHEQLRAVQRTTRELVANCLSCGRNEPNRAGRCVACGSYMELISA